MERSPTRVAAALSHAGRPVGTLHITNIPGFTFTTWVYGDDAGGSVLVCCKVLSPLVAWACAWTPGWPSRVDFERAAHEHRVSVEITPGGAAVVTVSTEGRADSRLGLEPISPLDALAESVSVGQALRLSATTEPAAGPAAAPTVIEEVGAGIEKL